MQYVHGIFTQLAHRMHRPQEEPLHDVGFDLTPVRQFIHRSPPPPQPGPAAPTPTVYVHTAWTPARLPHPLCRSSARSISGSARPSSARCLRRLPCGPSRPLCCSASASTRSSCGPACSWCWSVSGGRAFVLGLPGGTGGTRADEARRSMMHGQSCSQGSGPRTPSLRAPLLPAPAVCQALRIVTFSVTQLPGPSYHCRAGEATAVRPWPEHWTGHVVVDVGRQMSKSCGDLIFSSHTTFMLTGAPPLPRRASPLPSPVHQPTLTHDARLRNSRPLSAPHAASAARAPFTHTHHSQASWLTPSTASGRP